MKNLIADFARVYSAIGKFTFLEGRLGISLFLQSIL